MQKIHKDNIIAGYVNNLTNIEELNIKQLVAFGYVSEDCSTNLFHIAIECIKHIEIFNEEQTANILNIINKLSLNG